MRWPRGETDATSRCHLLGAFLQGRRAVFRRILRAVERGALVKLGLVKLAK
jgi:hypothetical protein